MKRILYLFIIGMAICQAQASPVDPSAAEATVIEHIRSMSSGRMRAPARTDIKLIHTEVSSTDASLAAYYIFNTSDGFYIVSGDDRAREVLAHGDEPLDMNNIPENMKVWLLGYKEQLDYLLAHPQLVVNKGPQKAPADDIESIPPMITAKWNQSEPFYNECPFLDDKRCVTGCSATSLSQVFYFWKYPKDEVPALSSYVTDEQHIFVEALPPTTFDWDNMLDVYYPGGYNEVQATAVAHLMRYVGQSERMDYAPGGSGASSDAIMWTVRRFGYSDEVSLIFKDNWWWEEDSYSDEEWAAIMIDELENGRPMVMCAWMEDLNSYSGHAFNVDGYDADDNTFHINFGWGGSGNAYYALNAFGYTGMMFNLFQQLIIGIEPIMTEPTIRPNTSFLNIKAYEDSTTLTSFGVRGFLLDNDVTLTLNDENGVFGIDTYSIDSEALSTNQRVHVTYSPKVAGTHTATITLSSPGAEDQIITINGTCLFETYDPVVSMLEQGDDNSYTTEWEDKTPQRNIDSYQIEITPIPYFDLRMTDSFDKSEYEGTSTADYGNRLDEVTDVPGWTGSKVYRMGSDLLLGTNKAKGWIETPALDMFYNQRNVTVTVIARCNGATESSPLKIQCGGQDTTITLSNTETEYNVLLPCPPSGDAKVKFSTATGSRAIVCGVSVFAGDHHSPITADNIHASSIKGITGNSYTFNVSPGYYAMHLQCLYTNGETSQWTPWEPFSVSWDNCDTNHDGEIGIADINQVIDAIVMDIRTPSSLEFNDVDGDGEITISDINVIIDALLNL